MQINEHQQQGRPALNMLRKAINTTRKNRYVRKLETPFNKGNEKQQKLNKTIKYTMNINESQHLL